MKAIFYLITILFTTTTLIGQNKFKTKPFIIQGQITDCPEKNLKIFFQNKNGQSLMDTLQLDALGKFYLKTFKVDKPQIASIQQNNIQINDFFIAPGYNLTITGIGKDYYSLAKSKKISGVGAESNRYRFLLDSILLARNDATKWWELNENDLLAYISKNQKLKDSIIHVVFDRNPVQDRFLKYFGSLVRLDITFSKLYMLLSHVKWNNYNYENSISFVRNNFDHTILDNMFKSEYLISEQYKGLMGNDYIDYLVTLDYKKDSTLRDQKGYKLKKINEIYQGKVKEFALYHRMESLIENSNSFEKLNAYKEQFANYISNLKNQYYKKSLESKFVEKETELLRTQVGKPAPGFTLENRSGNTYSLADYKGKVVYLDLWASWCGPCREETPAFRILYNRYKEDNRIVFISIAVHDGINNWKKALEEDKPEWLQLIDKQDQVWKSYVANFIPKFIVIDKAGNIVNFDAPRPSSGKEIENILNAEMAK